VNDPNVSGQAYALTVMTPIERGREDELRAYLEALGRPSPLERLKRTHFGRWVIIPDYHAEAGQQPDSLGSPHLIFTACFDGDRDSYLDELCDKLAVEAEQIWGRTGAELKRHLVDNQLKTGFFFAAYGQAKVEEVQRAVEQRDRMIAFAVATQGASPEDLQGRFRGEFGA
jgi:hypothetical protein